MRALVTGAGGFLGRHFVSTLLDRGYEVEGIDLVNVHHPLNMLRHLPELKVKYDLAIHAAAHVGGRSSIDGRRTYLAAYNLQLDACFVGWALRERPRHVVLISSSAVYPVSAQTSTAVRSGLGESLVDPRRDVMYQPDATYGFTKLVLERLACELSDECPDVAVHVVRPFSGYGADQDLDYPFPSFRERAANREDPFEIWGSGFQTRDWVHVDDVVGATLAVVDQDFREPVNVCTGRPTSFVELAKLFVDATGDESYCPSVKTLPHAPRGVFYRVGDPRKMLQLYVPKISIEDGVKEALAT